MIAHWSSFVQFYLDTLELVVSQDSSLLFVEYSVNGGIEWTMFEVIPLDGPPIRKLFQVPFPSRALTPATRIKWSHINSQNSQPLAIWTVDEVVEEQMKAMNDSKFFYDYTCNSNMKLWTDLRRWRVLCKEPNWNWIYINRIDTKWLDVYRGR